MMKVNFELNGLRGCEVFEVSGEGLDPYVSAQGQFWELAEALGAVRIEPSNAWGVPTRHAPRVVSYEVL